MSELQKKLLPGIIDEGEHIIAYKFITEKGEAFVYASPLAREFKRTVVDYAKVELIPFNSNYSDLFRAKVGVRTGIWKTGTSTIELKENGYLSISIGEKIKFELDENGVLVGSSEKIFRPIIELKDKDSGETYKIDLRGVYFSNIEQITSDTNGYDAIYDRYKNEYHAWGTALKKDTIIDSVQNDRLRSLLKSQKQISINVSNKDSTNSIFYKSDL